MASLSRQLPAQARTAFASALGYTLIAATVSAGVVLAPCSAALAQGAAASPKPRLAAPAATAPIYAQQGGWGPPPGGPPPGYGPPAGYGYPPEDLAKARVDGERDAEADMNGALWFGAGCLLGWIGILLGYVIEPTPPASHLVGRSPDYVSTYSMAYKSAGKSAQGKTAIYGCLVGTAVAIAVYVILVVAVLNTANNNTNNGY